MLFIVFSIAVLNLALGFVAAVHLGYGPPSLAAAWQAWNGGGRAATKNHASSSGDDSDNDLDMSELGVDDDDLGSLLDMDMDEDEDLLTESMRYGPSGNDADSSNEGAFEDEGSPATVDPNAPENWDLNDKYIETSVFKLNIAMMKSGARATAVDSRLRACGGSLDAELLKTLAGQLKEDCETYLAEQEEAAGKLRERLDEFGELAGLAEEIEMDNMEQAAQIETTLSNLNMIDFSSDPKPVHLRLLEELSNLREARHKLRDGQDVAYLTIAKYEGRIDKIPTQLRNDKVTGLHNRIGLESTLADWWSVSKNKKNQMTASLFDMDDFASVNSQHGPAAADNILAKIARLMEELAGTGDLLGRFAGQRFLWIAVDKGPRAATKDAEALRQLVDRAIFECAGTTFGLTMCGGYTEISQDDTVEEFVKRLETAMALSKKSGPNHGSFHDGREAEIVESPKLGSDCREVNVD